MITRIVKLTISPGKEPLFLDIFNQSKIHIRSSAGCRGLKLYRDHKFPNIFFTYSHWETPQDLENYRNSALFQATWKETKKLFADRPQAWSLNFIEKVEPAPTQ